MEYNVTRYGADTVVRWAEEYPNRYGVSVVVSPYSYGGKWGFFELAVLHDGDICTLSDITDDVLGHLTFAGVAEVIDKVKALPVESEHVHN